MAPVGTEVSMIHFADFQRSSSLDLFFKLKELIFASVESFVFSASHQRHQVLLSYQLHAWATVVECQFRKQLLLKCVFS